MRTPEEIKSHANDYKDRAWEDYSIEELGQWVHLLITRSYHRKDVKKALKDIEDAENYWHMMKSHIDSARTNVSV
jgi:hypothetical protein